MTKNNVAKNPDELLIEIEKASINSPLKGISDIYRNYYHLLEFIFESKDSITDEAFIGESGFIGTNIEYGGQKLFTEVKNTDGISVGDFCFFSVDLLNFIITNLDPVCESNTEVIEILSNFAQRYKFGSYDKAYDSFVDKYREIRSLKQDSEHNLFAVSDSDLLLLQFFATMRNFFKVMGSHITWVEEPSIGDYITFHIGRNSSKSDINKFEVVCKITDKKYNEDFDVNTYNYNIIAYDSELLDVYPNYWIFEYEDDESKLIEPIHSSFITVHSENPIGN